VPEQKLCANEGGEGRFYRKPCTPRAAPSCAAHDGPARVVVLPRGSLILPRQQPLESSSISVRVPFFYPIFGGSFGGLLELKLGHAAYRRKALDVLFLTI
jgi:hypothetical protein